MLYDLGNLKKCLIISGVLFTLSSLPFLANLMGPQIYLKLHTKNADWIFAATQGLCHLAKDKPSPEHAELNAQDFGGSTPDIYNLPPLPEHKSLKLGPIELLIEDAQEMHPLRFHRISATEFSNYSGVEFPWLIFPTLIFSIGGGLALRIRGNEDKASITATEPESQNLDSQL